MTEDEQYRRAVTLVVETEKASTSFIQRHLQIGYNRAACLLDRMVEEGIVTAPDSVGKRTVLRKANQ